MILLVTLSGNVFTGKNILENLSLKQLDLAEDLQTVLGEFLGVIELVKQVQGFAKFDKYT